MWLIWLADKKHRSTEVIEKCQLGTLEAKEELAFAVLECAWALAGVCHPGKDASAEGASVRPDVDGLDF